MVQLCEFLAISTHLPYVYWLVSDTKQVISNKHFNFVMLNAIQKFEILQMQKSLAKLFMEVTNKDD